MIKEINLKTGGEEFRQTLNKAFLTVAEELGLRKESAPTNPAFITLEMIKEQKKKKEIQFYGYYKDSQLIGCFALEQGDKETFYLERLGVLPGHRHKGIGGIMVKEAMNKVRKAGGKRVSIGIIDSNKVLKSWYKKVGFIEREKKEFSHLPFSVCFMMKEV